MRISPFKNNPGLKLGHDNNKIRDIDVEIDDDEIKVEIKTDDDDDKKVKDRGTDSNKTKKGDQKSGGELIAEQIRFAIEDALKSSGDDDDIDDDDDDERRIATSSGNTNIPLLNLPNTQPVLPTVPVLAPSPTPGGVNITPGNPEAAQVIQTAFPELPTTFGTTPLATPLLLPTSTLPTLTPSVTTAGGAPRSVLNPPGILDGVIENSRLGNAAGVITSLYNNIEANLKYDEILFNQITAF